VTDSEDLAATFAAKPEGIGRLVGGVTRGKGPVPSEADRARLR